MDSVSSLTRARVNAWRNKERALERVTTPHTKARNLEVTHRRCGMFFSRRKIRKRNRRSATHTRFLKMRVATRVTLRDLSLHSQARRLMI